jgi:hypothetical protein
MSKSIVQIYIYINMVNLFPEREIYTVWHIMEHNLNKTYVWWKISIFLNPKCVAFFLIKFQIQYRLLYRLLMNTQKVSVTFSVSKKMMDQTTIIV